MRYLTEQERGEREQRVAALRALWIGAEIDYGHFTRTVFAIGLDEQDRLILHLRRKDDPTDYVCETVAHCDLELTD